MKLSDNHFKQLQDMIRVKINTLSESIEDYYARYQTNGDNWEVRFRWDLLYSITFADRDKWFREVYKYADDRHIDTGLRKIMKDYM